MLVPDREVPGAYFVRIDGTDQSFVDPTDPLRLEFDYVQRIAEVIDTIAPTGERIRVVHVGGAGMTLPRYIAATRPTLRTPIGKRRKWPSVRDQTWSGSTREEPALASRCRHCVWSGQCARMAQSSQRSPGPISQMRASATAGSRERFSTMRASTVSGESACATSSAACCRASGCTGNQDNEISV